MTPDWMADAACRTVATAVMFPDSVPTGRVKREESKAYAAARAVCGRCPVRVECAAAGQGEEHGVWGGELASRRAS